MRFIIFFALVLVTRNHSFCQDGSDIRYYRNEDITKSLTGKTAQIDFYRWSFRGKISKIIDTVEIEVDNRKLTFTEKRNDDGYNNWFHQQYLESIDPSDGKVTRIIKFRIAKVSKKHIVAEGFIEVYDRDLKLIDEKAVKYEFKRDIIAGLLIGQ